MKLTLAAPPPAALRFRTGKFRFHVPFRLTPNISFLNE